MTRRNFSLLLVLSCLGVVALLSLHAVRFAHTLQRKWDHQSLSSEAYLIKYGYAYEHEPTKMSPEEETLRNEERLRVEEEKRLKDEEEHDKKSDAEKEEEKEALRASLEAYEKNRKEIKRLRNEENLHNGHF